MIKKLKAYWLKLKNSNTLIFGAALVILGGIETYSEFFQEFMTPKAYGIFTIAVGLGVKVLRFTTNKSLDDKVAEALEQTKK